LKAATDSEFLIALGSLFHNVGAATAKALSPYNFVLNMGTTSRLEISDKRLPFSGLSQLVHSELLNVVLKPFDHDLKQ